MASYSFSNISPTQIGSCVTAGYSGVNLSNLMDGNESTWARIKRPTSGYVSDDIIGFRLFFNFNTMPNGKTLPDDATVTSFTIVPISVCDGYSSYIGSEYYSCGVRFLSRWATNSNDENGVDVDIPIDIENGIVNASIVAEEDKPVALGDFDNRYFKIKGLESCWISSGDTPGSYTFNIQTEQTSKGITHAVERKQVELVGFAYDSQLAITPQNLKTTFVTTSGNTVCCLSPTIVWGRSGTTKLDPNYGLGMNEVYANMSVTLPSITISTVKSVPSGKDFTITGTGGDGQWSGTQITTDAWGGSTQSNITLTASNIPNDCYFVGWYKNGELIPGSGLSINFQPTENVTYTAQIALKPIVTFSSTEGGTITVTAGGTEISSGDPVDVGTTINVSMVASDGYYFDSYDLNGTIIRPTEVASYSFSHTVNVDTTIISTFIANTVLTLTAYSPSFNENDPNSESIEVSYNGTDWNYSIQRSDIRPGETCDCYVRDGEQFYFTGTIQDEFGNVPVQVGDHYVYTHPAKVSGGQVNISIRAYQEVKPTITFVPYYVIRDGAFPTDVRPGGSEITATVDGSPITSGTFLRPGTQVTLVDTPLDGYSWGLWVDMEQGTVLSQNATYVHTMSDNIIIIGGTYEWPSIQIQQFNKTGGDPPIQCEVRLDGVRKYVSDVTIINPDVSHTISIYPSTESFVYSYTEIDGTTHICPASETSKTQVDYTFTVQPSNNKSFVRDVRYGDNPTTTIDIGVHTPSGKESVPATGRFRVYVDDIIVPWGYLEHFQERFIKPGQVVTIEAEDNWTAIGAEVSGYYHSMDVTQGSSTSTVYTKTHNITQADENDLLCIVNFTGYTISATQIPCTGTTEAGDVLTVTANPSYTNRTSDVVMTASLASVDPYRNLPYIQSTILPEVKSRLTTAYGTTIEQVDFICTKPANSDEINAVDTGWAWAIYHGIVPRRYNAGYTARWSRFYMTDQNSNEHVIKWQINRDTGDISYQFLSGKTYVDITNLSDIILYTSQKVRNRDVSTYDWYYDGMSADEFDSLYAENELDSTNEEYIFQEGEAQHGFIAGHYRFDHWDNNGTISTENPWATTFSTATQSTETHEYTSNIDAYYRRYVTLTLQLHEEYPQAGSLTGAGNYDIGEDGSATAEITGIPNQGYTWRQWEKTDGTPISTENPYMCPLMQDETIVGRFWHQFMLTVQVFDETTLEKAGTATGSGMHVVGEQVTMTVTPYDYYLFNEWQDEPGLYDNPRVIAMPAFPQTYTALCTPKAKLVYEGGQTLYDKGITQVVAVYQGDTEIELKLR